jgi:hypothetical protein
MSYVGNTPFTAAFQTDTFSGNGTTTAFTMSVAPANTTSIIVAVTGVVQDPSTYSVSGTTLTFSAAPPTGTSNISVRFLGIPASGVTTTAYRTITDTTATAGQTSFSVPSYTIGYIDVYRNGVRLVSTDFTATTGTTVVLNNGCTVGDALVTESFYVSSVLNAIPATAGAVNSTYIADNAITTAAIADNAITTAKIAAGAVVQADLATGVAGTGPSFSAYLNSTQAFTAGVWTKVQLNAEEWDTNNNFDSTTNYRFTPTVAGYYQINCEAASVSSTFSGTNYLGIYKNGSLYRYSVISTYGMPVLSSMVYFNGSTDYIELYTNLGTSQNLTAGSTGNFMNGGLVRAA